MPEYLAPGVYVEETSFRSKSIEGVSTSTTAFVGLSRKGPVAARARMSAEDVEKTVGTPEIITSFVDFERVFGGFEDIALKGDSGPVRNYLAHAVNAFFANGGGRLYVARVVGDGATEAQTKPFASGAYFKARVPGAAANGRLVFSLAFTPLHANTWANLPAWTVVREGDGKMATPAKVTGALLPRFSVQDGDFLALKINDLLEPITGTFRGRKASVTGTAAANITIGAHELVEIVVGGQSQQITLDRPVDGNTRPIAEVAAELNTKLRGVSVSLEGLTITIATDRAGAHASLQVKGAPGELNLSKVAVTNDFDKYNNVAALDDLTVQDLRAVFEDEVNPKTPNSQAMLEVSELVEDGKRRFVFTTVKIGTDAKLQIDSGTAADALGLTRTATPTNGAGDEFGNFTVKGAKPTSTDSKNKQTGDFPGEGKGVYAVSLTITAIDADGHARQYDDLGLDHRHGRFVGKMLPEKPSRKTESLENLYYLKDGDMIDGAEWARELVECRSFQAVGDSGDSPEKIEREIHVNDGKDGGAPSDEQYRLAFGVLDRLDDISIVAAPGYAASEHADAIEEQLLIHVQKRRAYRIGVLDARKGQSIGEVRNAKARLDSKHAALYYPWVVIANPLWRPGDASIPREIAVPPSGFVTGIYARNDAERGVFKTPANEIVRGALRFETDINFAQQEVLNPLGINCLRFFPGRGYRVWGGRTLSSDPEWKYVSVRRYFNYLERSIDVGTQWAVFEPNGERLWANVRETIASYLLNEWRSGALLGGDAKEAFFVRCDRSTMDQNDLDNGRLVCLIGVAVVKPAEFVIFRVGQKTADARS